MWTRYAVLGLALLIIACDGTRGPLVHWRRPPRPHVGDRVRLPSGIVVTELETGLVLVQVRIRATGNPRLDVVTLACDPMLLEVVRR